MLSDGLTGEELDALIAELRDAYKAAMLGGGVGSVQGEGRKIEYTRANISNLRAELRAALREKERQDPNYEGGNALMVEL
jgi:hypothetical protein